MTEKPVLREPESLRSVYKMLLSLPSRLPDKPILNVFKGLAYLVLATIFNPHPQEHFPPK